MSGARSIWDGDEEDDEGPWFLRRVEDEEDAPQPAGRDVDLEELAARAAAAQADHAGLLYEAGLRLGGFATAAAGARADERLRATEVSDLMWRHRAAVRPERLALHEIGAPGGLPLEGGRARAQDYAFAVWALGRLRAATAPSSMDRLRVWLDRRAHATGPAGLEEVVVGVDPVAQEAALARWLAAQAVLTEVSAPVRAGVLASLWAATPEFGPERKATATLIGAVVTAEEVGAAFAPVASAASLRSVLGKGDPAEAVGPWLAAVRDGAARAAGELQRLAAWRARAGEITDAMQGRGPGRLATALGDHVALSVAGAAELTGFTQPAMLSAMKRLERERLAREITRAKRFRYWTAAL